MKRLGFLKRPKFFIPLIIVVLFIGAVGLAVHNLNGPAQGTVTTPISNTSSAASNIPGSTTYSDKYISFNYPSQYIQVAPTKDPSYLDTLKLIKSDRHDQYASIGVIKESLATDSGVRYRRLHPELYKVTSSSPTTIVFSKLDQTEYTGFIQHGDLVISVSLTSVSSAAMSADYNTIANSLEWKQ